MTKRSIVQPPWPFPAKPLPPQRRKPNQQPVYPIWGQYQMMVQGFEPHTHWPSIRLN
ncbi:MAG: hypothetical protein H6638_09305 [Ardenticatenales bacterium]|nr:hypothetical protein [Ardenticatenales bacterium]